MGITGWFNVFGDSAVPIKEKNFRNKNIGVDVSYDIYRASLGMKNIKGLTDKDGVPTVLLNTMLCNVVKYKKLKIKGLVYIFDNPKPNPHKKEEQKKRRKERKKAEDKLEKEQIKEKKHKLEKRTFVITDDMVADVKKLLTLLGVAWIITPEGYEAEHLGAELSNDGIIDTLITSDSDALLFGAKSITRRITKRGSKKKQYQEFTLDNVLVDYELTREQLVHLGVVLGSDFADKTKGIGIKTVLEKGPKVKLTEQQEKAAKYFLSKCPYDTDMINKSVNKKNELIRWLVDNKNFNEKRITKLLSVF